MANTLTVINEQEVLGKNFRIYGTVEEPLFLAKDVAEWIEHSNPTEMVRTIDADEKLNSTILSAGQNRECTFLTEDGLYEVLMQSRKPIAKQFKKKVKEILRTIRTTGGYVGNDEKFISTYLPFADEATKGMFRATLELVNKQNELIRQQREEINYQGEVIEAMVENISLADKRQILNRVMRHNAGTDYVSRWSLLYKEFDSKYHMNTKLRMERHNLKGGKCKSRLDYIDKVEHKLEALYEIEAKLFHEEVNSLVNELYAIRVV